MRPRGGLLAAVIALVAAVGLALAVTAFTAARTKNHAVGAPSGADGHTPAAAAPTTTKPPIPKVSHGTLLSVKAVDDKGVALAGAVTGAEWTSTGVVVPSRTYQLQAYVRSLTGVAAYHTLQVATSAPASTESLRVTLQVGPAVGVGWPITVRFNSPVTNRAAVQNALQVQTSVPVTGAWHWFSDTEVHFRPEVYWPTHTKITLHRDLDGVEVAPGVWGVDEQDVQFNVGDSHVSTVDTVSHRMTVTVNGQYFNTYKVSTGRPSLPTLNGVHIVLEKWASIQMNSETLIPPIHKLLPDGKKNPLAYDEKELWATRISNAGAFVHYNPDTLKEQGASDASHGCINTNLQDAEQFYNLSLPGDIVKVINSPAPPNRSDPGMADWNYSWAQWLQGSATA